jgi:hypothetical protein
LAEKLTAEVVNFKLPKLINKKWREKMKNHLFTLVTMVLVMLFVVSLSEAQDANFHIEDPAGDGTVHLPGTTFDIEFRVDATGMPVGNIWRLQFDVLIDPIDAILPTNVVTPFTMVEGSISSVVTNTYDPVAGRLRLTTSSGTPGSGGPSTGSDILIATVNFISQVPPTANLSYTNLGTTTTYRLVGVTGAQTPTVDPIDVPLPIELSAFTVVPADKGVIIKWRTESELNNLGFDVYRSENLDGTFAKVNQTRIRGAGTDATPHSYKFVDESVEVGKTYYYYLEDISYSGVKGRSKVIQVTVDLTGKLKVVSLTPAKSALLQNYPNPFNPETWIPFQLALDSSVIVRIYNLKGQPIRTLELGQKEAGTYLTKDKAVYWDGRDNVGEKVASGMYFYMLRAGEFTSTRRMVIIE